MTMNVTFIRDPSRARPRRAGGLVMTSIDSSGVVDFYAEPPGGSTWSDTRITGISFPMDAPAIAAN